jgi:hypothetical protein
MFRAFCYAAHRCVSSFDEFIDENGGGPGVRLKKRPQKKRA